MSEAVEKYVQNNKVAVLVSHGYGAGWSTWDNHKEIAWDKRVVEFFLENGPDVEEEKLKEFMKSIGYENVYLGGWDGIRVEWVNVGDSFRITEYDGDETLETKDDLYWEKA